MKKYFWMLSSVAAIMFAACGNTTNSDANKEINTTADSAVGNSEAANTIYRDSADISHATEPGGGTGNPSNNDPGTESGSDEDSIRR